MSTNILWNQPTSVRLMQDCPCYALNVHEARCNCFCYCACHQVGVSHAELVSRLKARQ